jgi:hypothetical protein
MDKRSVTIERLPIQTPHKGREGVEHYLDVEVLYDKGGMSLFSGKTFDRGYYVKVAPIEIDRSDSGVVMLGFRLGAGRRKFIEGAKSFRQSQLENVANLVRLTPDLYADIKAFVIEKENLQLLDNQVGL